MLNYPTLLSTFQSTKRCGQTNFEFSSIPSKIADVLSGCLRSKIFQGGAASF